MQPNVREGVRRRESGGVVLMTGASQEESEKKTSRRRPERQRQDKLEEKHTQMIFRDLTGAENRENYTRQTDP